ncbi:MAG: SRPBCC family protein [Acidimicrobiales bacterium]
MKLTNEFRVPCGVDQAWSVMTDLAKIAPCFPGASLSGSSGDEYNGKVNLDMGSVKLVYQGAARFTERNAGSHRAVLTASGSEIKGQGNANASVTATLSGEGSDSTRVKLDCDINVSGKAVQMGRGMETDVTTALINVFAENLQGLIGASGGRSAAASSSGGDKKRGGLFRRG